MNVQWPRLPSCFTILTLVLATTACGGGGTASGNGPDADAFSDVDAVPATDTLPGTDTGTDNAPELFEIVVSCLPECSVLDARRCLNATTVERCGDFDADECLEWGEDTPCGDGLACNEGVCETTCISECSEEHATRCDEAGRVVTCIDSDGQGCLKWATASPCEPPLVCSEGHCGAACTNECNPGDARRCTEASQTRFEVCGEYDGDGCLEWGTPQACEGMLVCSEGECVATCSDECDTAGDFTCDGNGRKECGEYDGDGCLEWGSVVWCEPGYACDEGICEKIETPEVVINEVLYDSESSPDRDSFVELKGPPNLALDNWVIVGVNGAGGKDYNKISLSGMQIGSDGFFVVAHPDAIATVHAASDLDSSSVDYQNGPDSIQLRFVDQVVDALAYGVFSGGDVAAGEGAPAPKTTKPGRSLGRNANGSDTNDNLIDFHEYNVPTPGGPNVVGNQLPVARLACPLGGKVGDERAFDASGSTDADGTIVAFTFTFGDGGSTSGTQAGVTHAYAQVGVFEVAVEVTDDAGGKANADCSVTIAPASEIPATVTDRDGNVYDTVQIGTQVWLKQNLRTTTYRNGVAIPNLKTNDEWTVPPDWEAGAYCDYNNTPANSVIYGRLYNWEAVVHTFGLCPKGWHVPTDAEWNTLETYLDDTVNPAALNEWVGEDVGSQLKEAGTEHWGGINTGATNSSGFTALPGGARNWLTGAFLDLGQGGWYYSSSQDPDEGGYLHRRLRGDETGILRNKLGATAFGLSVRCLMD